MSKKYVSNFKMPNGERIYVRTPINLTSDRKFIFIGDSYGDGYNPTGDGVGWPTLVSNCLGKTIGVNAWSASTGSAGFCRAENDNRAFDYLLNTVIAQLTTSQKEEITDVVFGGGYNELGHTNNEIFAGMARCRTLVRNNLPNAKMWVLAIGWSIQSESRRNLCNIYRSAYSENANQHNMIYRECYDSLQDTACLSADGVHPSYQGYVDLATAISRELIDGKKNQVSNRFPIKDDAENTLGYASIENGLVTLQFNRRFITFNSQLDWNTFSLIGEIQCRYLFGTSGSETFTFNLPAIIILENDKYYNSTLSCKFVRENGKVNLYATSNAANADHTGTLNPNVVSLSIQNGSAVIPICLA